MEIIRKNFVECIFENIDEKSKCEKSLTPFLRETRNHLARNRSNRLSRKKKTQRVRRENMEKEVFESRSSSSLETARKSKYPLCGGFKKKKKCLPAPSGFSRSEYAY